MRQLLTLRRPVTRVLSVLLAALFLFGSAPASLVQADPAPRGLPRLMREALVAPDRTFRVLVGRQGRGNEAESFVTGRGNRRIKDLGKVGFVAEVRGRDIALLARLRGVRWLTIDAPIQTTATVDATRLATVFDQTLNASPLWAQGITGQGVGIAIVDTGVDEVGGDFKDPATGLSRVVVRTNVTSSSTTVSDGFGHGTHVAGIAAGNSWTQPGSSPTQGKYVGVAPGAKVIAVRVADDQGRTYLSDVIQGIEWVIANRQAHNIRVLNLSLQSTVAESATTSYLAAAVERAWMNGIVVVVSAGNQGANSAFYPPGNDPFAITVGASDPVGTASRADDGMAPWSTYGTTQDGFSKPDVVAPGRYITSVLASGSPGLRTLFPGRVVDGSYLWLSGTSMASPQVAGVAALALQNNPGLTNDGLKWLLANTSTRVGGSSPPPGQGAGLVDASAVATYAGTIGVANLGLPINVHLIGPNGLTIYTPLGATGATWTEGGWDSTSWTEGGWDSTSWTEGGWDSTSWTSTPPQTGSVR
jgi:serine protease AprX